MYKARVGKTEMYFSFSNKSGKAFLAYGTYWDQEVYYHVAWILFQKRTFHLLWVPLPSKRDRMALSDGDAQGAWHSGLGVPTIYRVDSDTWCALNPGIWGHWGSFKSMAFQCSPTPSQSHGTWALVSPLQLGVGEKGCPPFHLACCLGNSWAPRVILIQFFSSHNMQPSLSLPYICLFFLPPSQAFNTFTKCKPDGVVTWYTITS